jgi:hypothetical protein
MRTRCLAVALAALLIPCGPATAAQAAPRASAAQVQRIAIDATERRFCATRGATGAGVERTSVTAPHDGVVGARLSGAGDGDWDLAILDGVRAGCSTAPRARAWTNWPPPSCRRGRR